MNAPANEPPTLLERVKTSPVTFAIAAINVAWFIYVETHGSTQDVGTLLRFGANERLHVAMGEWWRLGSYMVLHIGWVHLLWNTYASVGWSTSVETALGKPRFLALYVLSGIGAGCVSAIGQHAVSAGASGAMFGMVGAAFVLRYRELGSFQKFTRDRYVRTNAINIAIWIAIGLTAVKMDNWAHGGGLVVGALAALVATSKVSSQRLFGWLAICAGIGIAATVAARPGFMPSDEEAKFGAELVSAYASGTEGLPNDPARAKKLADLVCRRPDTDACARAKCAITDTCRPAVDMAPGAP